MGRSAVATAWLATEHQQLMYLLSPEGKTVFYIPGVEVVHKVSTPINLPDEASKIKMEPGKMQPPPGGSRKRAAGLSLDLNSASAKRNKQVQSLLTSPDVQMLKLTSPELDMETQEKIKLDRKRQRNRLAASKCRKRKLERISQLDDRVSALKNENADLAAVVKKMKAGVALLKQEVIEHVNSGCDIRVAEGTNF